MIIRKTKEKVKEEEYVHINDDPHDGWWLRPEHQDVEFEEPEGSTSLESGTDR